MAAIVKENTASVRRSTGVSTDSKIGPAYPLECS
jgi:hypothetical protein